MECMECTLCVPPLGEEKAVSSRLLVPTRIANLTRITDKMPTTKNSVILVVDCIVYDIALLPYNLGRGQ